MELEDIEATRSTKYEYGKSYNGPEIPQDGPNQIPHTMDPQILDIRHGLHMPDMPTANVGNSGFDEFNTEDLEPNPDANETQSEDANPGPNRRNS